MGPLDLLHPEAPSRFGTVPRRNAYVELHNLIVAAGSLAEYGPSDRVRISRRHGVDLAVEFADERRALYQHLLDDRLANGDLDAEDRHLLGHLAATLALTAEALRPAHERAFGTSVSEAVSDDCLSVEERLLLYKLQHLLGLDPRLADGAYDVLARERLMKTIAGALCDGLLAPEEEAEIERVRAALSLDIPVEVRRMLDYARERWTVRRGELPTAEVGIDLAAGEIGRMRARARWSPLDIRRFQRHVGEVALQSGRTAGLHVPSHVLRGDARSGDVILTDRRLILQPDLGLPDEVRMDRLYQLLRFQNGTVLRTKSERYVYLDPGDRNEVLYALLHQTVFGREKAAPD
jgi:hypothetical protein